MDWKLILIISLGILGGGLVYLCVRVFQFMNYLGIDIVTITNSTNPNQALSKFCMYKMVEKAHLLAMRGKRLLIKANQEDEYVAEISLKLQKMHEDSSILRGNQKQTLSLYAVIPYGNITFKEEVDHVMWRTYVHELRQFVGFSRLLMVVIAD